MKLIPFAHGHLVHRRRADRLTALTCLFLAQGAPVLDRIGRVDIYPVPVSLVFGRGPHFQAPLSKEPHPERGQA